MADAPFQGKAATAILIVEDHDIMRAALRDWLNTQFPNYQISEARSAEEALQLAADRPFVLVVMDLSLPGMSGIQATRLIKGFDSSARVVILTIHEEQFYQTEALAAGADGFVLKRDMETALLPVLRPWLTPNPSQAVGHSAGETC